MNPITLTLNHAEAVFLANALSAVKDQQADLGLRETDSSQQHLHMVNFRHAEQIHDRLDELCRHVVMGW
jgi:hypothetical protein